MFEATNMKNLKRGDVVFMKPSTCEGWGNEQCISGVCEPLGEISLFGHNQAYKTYDVARVVSGEDLDAPSF